MGIPRLNAFFRENASCCMQTIKLNELAGKKIVVDASIYLYRYATEGSVIEGMFQLISVCIANGVRLLFVFDGPPPPQKAEVLKERARVRKQATEQCELLQQQLEVETNEQRKQEISEELTSVKKRTTRIDRESIRKVKNLMDCLGVAYVDSEGEADGLCAKIVKKGYAYACLSEDMDMFVYGCPRVLRYLSLLHETAVVYNTACILENLDITLEQFRQVCVLCGTDYNGVMKPSTHLKKGFQLLEEYKLECKDKNKGFYEWLEEENKANVSNSLQLYTIFYMFDIDTCTLSPRSLPNLPLIEKPDMELLKSILEPEGFIFS